MHDFATKNESVESTLWRPSKSPTFRVAERHSSSTGFPQTHMPILPKTMRPEAISEKVKPLCAGLLNAGLHFVQRESNPGRHTPRPIQCLCRTTATENHAIIGVVDPLGSENLTPPSDPPVLQKTVHIQVGEEGTDDSAPPEFRSCCPSHRWLRFVALVPLLDRNLQPPLDQTQHVPIDNPPNHALHQFGVLNGIKVLRQIGVYQIGIACTK
jgi:hypothetical protein